MAEEEVEILRMGHQGEGVAERTPPLFVPYTLPGERVRVATDESDHGSLKGILTPSPERIKPACTHFTRCGGVRPSALAGRGLCKLEGGPCCAGFFSAGH